jgi:PKD repeat protein
LGQLGFTYYLTVIEAGALSVTVTAAPSTICAGESSILTAAVTNGSGSETFAWSGSGSNSDTAIVSPSATTTYTVTVTDGGNTVTGSATVTVNNQPVAGFTSSSASMPTIVFTNTSQHATSYSWDFDDGSTGTDANPTHIYEQNGDFDVTLTATNTCGSDTETGTVTITGIYINSVENNLKFVVAPNPSEGVFTVTLAGTDGKPTTMRIYDLSGKSVFEETFTGSVERQMDLSSLPKGIYTLHLNSEKSGGVQRLVIR